MVKSLFFLVIAVFCSLAIGSDKNYKVSLKSSLLNQHEVLLTVKNEGDSPITFSDNMFEEPFFRMKVTDKKSLVLKRIFSFVTRPSKKITLEPKGIHKVVVDLSRFFVDYFYFSKTRCLFFHWSTTLVVDDYSENNTFDGKVDLHCPKKRD